MFAPDATLVAYTYNDHELVRGLLDQLPSWTARPKEVVVVDDGSAEPFTDERPDRIIRHDTNQGFAAAKRSGLQAATRKFICSLDCDIRPDADWLASCLPVAARPEVGVVSSPILTGWDEGVISRYLRTFMSLHQDRSGAVAALDGGGAWLMRREVWERSGAGMEPLSGPLRSDIAFFRRVAELGLALWINPDVAARQVRRFDRFSLARRIWLGQGYDIRAQAAAGAGLEETLLVAGGFFGRRMAQEQDYEPAFAYLDLLAFCFGAADLLRLHDGDAGCVGKLVPVLVGGNMGLGEVVRADVVRLVGTQSAESVPPESLQRAGALLRSLGGERLAELSEADVRTIRDEDAASTADFTVFNELN
jgi:glycosyltransferase involved in cell wall biosynthesis